MIKQRIKYYIQSKFQPPKIMYHGTSSKFLRSILKHGLNYNVAKEGVWQDEELNHRPSRKSHEGVYMAASGFTALIFARDVTRKVGGAPIICCCQVQMGSALPDEDWYGVVNDIRIDPKLNAIADNSYMLCMYYVPLLMSKNPFELLSFKTYFDYVMQFMRVDLTKHQDIHHLKTLVLNLLLTSMARLIGYHRHSSTSDYNKLKINYNLMDALNRELYTKHHELHTKYREPIEVPDKYQYVFLDKPQAQLEVERRQALDKFIRATKLMAKPAAWDNFREENNKVRFDQPIGFSGSNRIVCIFKMIEPKYSDTDKNYYITVLYGKLPPDFIPSYNKLQGADPERIIVDYANNDTRHKEL